VVVLRVKVSKRTVTHTAQIELSCFQRVVYALNEFRHAAQIELSCFQRVVYALNEFRHVQVRVGVLGKAKNDLAAYRVLFFPWTIFVSIELILVTRTYYFHILVNL
jgi:hypothetical protein